MRTNELLYIILKYLNDKRGTKLTQRKIFFANNISNNNAAVYNKTFNSAVKAGYIVMDGDYASLSPEYFVNTFHVKGGFQYCFYNQEEKYAVNIEAGCPIDGDVVLVRINDAMRYTGSVVKVLKRTSKKIVGTFVNQGAVSFVIPDNKQKYKHDIFVGNEMASEMPNYSRVELTVEPFDVGLKPNGIVHKVIRNAAEDSVNTKLSVLSKYGFSAHFPQQVLQEASSVKARVSYSAFKERVLVDVPVFIISEQNCSPFAVSAYKRKEGFEITIYTADIAAKVVEGSIIDKEAKKKALACCLNNEFIDIFPQEFLNTKIYFSEGQKRLAVAFKLLFGADGKLANYTVFEGIVEPSATINPNELMRYLAFRGEDFEIAHAHVIEDLMTLSDLYDVIDKSRLVFKRGNSIFPQNMSDEFLGDNVLDNLFYLLKLDCEKMTARIFAESNFPIVHSFYKLPNLFELERFKTQCEALQLNPQCMFEDKIQYEDVNSFLKTAPADMRFALKNNIVDMIGAKQYSMEHSYNYIAGGITAPIFNPSRNYAALYNQRLLKRYIKKTLFNDNVENKVLISIKDVCNVLNDKSGKKLAAEQEYTLTSLVSNFMGEDTVYTATAYSISPSGVKIVLESGLHGLVRFEDYALSDKEFKFVYAGKEHVIRIGDKFKVIFDYFDLKNNRYIFTYTE